MPGKVFSISAGEFINGVPHTWTFVETQTRSLADLGWAMTLSVVDDRTSIRGIARNVRRLRAEVTRSGAELVHAQYGSVTAAVADAARGALPLVISFCGSGDLLGTPEPGLLWRIAVGPPAGSGWWRRGELSPWWSRATISCRPYRRRFAAAPRSSPTALTTRSLLLWVARTPAPSLAGLSRSPLSSSIRG